MVDVSKNEAMLPYWKNKITTQHADILLLACCFSSGLLDSSVFDGEFYLALCCVAARQDQKQKLRQMYTVYGTFVAMQTGNTIFVGLGTSNQDTQPYAWARSITSIVCFALGALFFARIGSILGPKARLSLIGSFFVQASLILITAALLQAGVVSQAAPTFGEPLNWDNEVPIVLLAFQSAGQIVASRALGFNEVPTVVITSLLCDLMSDPSLFKLQNVKRDRRVIAFLLTLVGAISGGWITKASGSLSVSLWVAAGIKYAIAFSWMVWRQDQV
ncbi:hypothetical protein UA08_00808 [Talaromyces atroroseus]|uniref:DUF1275 domain protein n=1 Tax=Talaromyces atroroseus TaxID=1441469 RepID=A0A225BAN1_TALAT|nr:hypothetical protein UA08_00808 [Talaromyces atroroseus]OKL63975.1 hypothetical protein UA08_00808 [Talaromyces atroroseus]